MTIEYKIRFEEGGLTITQTTKPGISGELVTPNVLGAVVASHEIGASFRSKDKSDDAGPGGGSGARTGTTL